MIPRRAFLYSVFLLIALFGRTAEGMGSTLVNVDARANNLGNPKTVFLEAGTYAVVPIDTTQGGSFIGWRAWGETTCSDVKGCPKTSPTSFTGFMNQYDVISPGITTVSVSGIGLSPIGSEPSFLFQDFFLSSATQARYKVDDRFVYPNASAAFARARSSIFTLSTAGIVGFAIDDRAGLSDNAGGISLSIKATLEIRGVAAAIKIGQPYTQQLVGIGVKLPYTWSIRSGTLPAGLTLGSDGLLSGTPSVARRQK